MDIQLVTPPEGEPVGLPEIKGQTRVLHSSEDVLLKSYATAARQHVERVTGRALIQQTWALYLPAFPRCGIIDLPRPPLQSVTSMKYRDADDVEQTLAASNYHVLKHGLTGRIELKASTTWPAVRCGGLPVTVEFVAGYGTEPKAVPEDMRHAILLLTEHFYMHRSAVSETSMIAVPLSVDALLAPHRTFGWR